MQDRAYFLNINQSSNIYNTTSIVMPPKILLLASLILLSSIGSSQCPDSTYYYNEDL